MDNRCVCCGEIIPEGRQVCPNCENGPLREKLIELIDEAEELYLSEIETIADHLIANGVTIQRWLSVKDNLPNEGDMVIVCAGGEVGEGFRIGEYFRWADGFHIEKEVTHWMPLPEAPKGE